MLEQQGLVIAVSDESASIRVGGASGCSACDAGKGCGAGIFAKWFKRRPATLDLINQIDVRVGQTVIIGLPEAFFLALVFRLYLLPLVAGLAGMMIGHTVSGTIDEAAMVADGMALLGGMMAGSLAIWWNRRTQMEFPHKSSVHLLRILGHDDEKRCRTPES
jgi:sigma-E factor negative regulatory protein RseC